MTPKTATDKVNAPAVSQLAGEKWNVELVDNAQSGLSWTVIITFPNGERFEDEFGDGLDAAQAAEDWEKNLRSIGAALSEREEKVAKLKTLCGELLAWDKKHPKSHVMSYGGLLESEKELDGLIANIGAALSALGESKG